MKRRNCRWEAEHSNTAISIVLMVANHQETMDSVSIGTQNLNLVSYEHYAFHVKTETNLILWTLFKIGEFSFRTMEAGA